MLKNIINFYRVSQPKPCNEESLSEQKQRLKRFQWSTFLAATLGYGMYYVCRLSLNVVKKPIVDEGVFSETELGIIGAVLFFTYAVGKFMNGFLADRSNINRFMSTGLLVTALVNLCLGFVHSFILFAVLWGISGWFQSMGAASCVVGLSRWFTDKKRGSFYGFWSASHNIGEAMTFIIVASIVSALGWRYGFLGAGLVGQFGTGRIHIVTFEIEYTMNTCFIVVFAIIGIRCKQAFERTFCRTERSRFIVVIDKVVGTSFTGISTVTAIIINHIIE
jgi:OPA family sugar phosphate sensor protein UhpC-like MFS transporter